MVMHIEHHELIMAHGSDHSWLMVMVMVVVVTVVA